MDEARLQEMWDHHEIRQLLASYCHGCDRVDEAEMASVYCRESYDDHGEHKMDGKKFSAIATSQFRETDEYCTHQLGQSLIRVHGDTAGAETYFIATLLKPNDEDDNGLRQLGGRYVDWLEREDGQWRIKKRICIREWSISHRIENDFLEGAGFIEPERSQRDPSYAALGLEHSGIPAGL